MRYMVHLMPLPYQNPIISFLIQIQMGLEVTQEGVSSKCGVSSDGGLFQMAAEE